MRTLLASVAILLAITSVGAVAQEETLWAVVATVSIPGHEVIPYQAQLFKTEEECETFRVSPEHADAVKALTEYEQNAHADLDLTITTECVQVGHR